MNVFQCNSETNMIDEVFMRILIYILIRILTWKNISKSDLVKPPVQSYMYNIL